MKLHYKRGNPALLQDVTLTEVFHISCKGEDNPEKQLSRVYIINIPMPVTYKKNI